MSLNERNAIIVMTSQDINQDFSSRTRFMRLLTRETSDKRGVSDRNITYIYVKVMDILGESVGSYNYLHSDSTI